MHFHIHKIMGIRFYKGIRTRTRMSMTRTRDMYSTGRGLGLGLRLGGLDYNTGAQSAH